MRLKTGTRFFISLVLLVCLSVSLYSQSVSVPVSTLEDLQREASLIRSESAALRILLQTLGIESAESRSQLAQAEARLNEAETLLRTASLSLEKSEADLIPLQEELGKLRTGLAELRKQAEESNRRLLNSEKQTGFWRTVAIISIVTFALVEGGRLLIK